MQGAAGSTALRLAPNTLVDSSGCTWSAPPAVADAIQKVNAALRAYRTRLNGGCICVCVCVCVRMCVQTCGTMRQFNMNPRLFVARHTHTPPIQLLLLALCMYGRSGVMSVL
jgi:hypothetical protein